MCIGVMNQITQDQAIKYKKMVKGKKRGEFFFEDEGGRPIGMLVEKKSETKDKK